MTHFLNNKIAGPFATQQSLSSYPIFGIYLHVTFYCLPALETVSPIKLGIFFNPLLYPQCLEQCQAMVDTQSMFVE